MRGADLVVKALSQAGVTTIFSLSGNQIMPIYDACIDANIRIIHTRHEAACVFMADAWAQATGEIGVALVTAAPGFANAIGALYSARQSESPVVFLSGDAPVGQDGKGAFQELDQVPMTEPLTKASYRALKTDELSDDIARAIRLARSGRPGPVHVALPFDVVQAEVNLKAEPTHHQFEPDVIATGSDVLSKITNALQKANYPLLLLGPALNRALSTSELANINSVANTPIIPMESPRGLNDPSLGSIAKAFLKADLIVSLGKSIDFTVGFGKAAAFGPSCEWIVVDADVDMLERARRNLGPRLMAAYQADPKQAALQLIAASGHNNLMSDREAWRSEVAEAVVSRSFQVNPEPVSARPITPAILCQAVQKQMDLVNDPILICDGGEFGQWSQACLTAPKRIINGPSGAIGGGLCYAIAASIAQPEATVFSLMGDGTVGFHFAEFETAVRCGAPIIVIIGHDSCWNAEHQIQLRDYGADRLIACELNKTRYDLAAQGLGCHGEHVTDSADLNNALERSIKSGLPACINVEIEGFPAPIPPKIK